jgi:hypothetical protein
MKAQIHNLAKGKGSRLAAAAVLAVLLVLLLGVQVAYAQASGGECLRDAADFDQTTICTADDVEMVGMVLLDGPASCIIGEQITVTLQVQLLPTANRRYDVGLYLAQDGGNALDRGTICYRDYLHPVTETVTVEDLTNGAGPFWDHDGDTCGDIFKNEDDVPGNTYYDIQPFSITCVDPDSDGLLELATVVSWDNGAGTECTNQADTVPGTRSKCRAEIVQLDDVQVFSVATLEVRKELIPATDPGRFDLEIDEQVLAAGVGDGGTTGPISVTAGSGTEIATIHYVTETAVAPADLADYDLSIYCVGQDDYEFSQPGPGPWAVPVRPDDVITCTITNLRNTGNIFIVKETDPPGISGVFTFTTNLLPSTFTLSDGEDQPFLGVPLGGPYVFTETIPAKWQLVDIECVGPNEEGFWTGPTAANVRLFGGETVTCTFVNDPLPAITVTKTADPAAVLAPGGVVEYTVRVDNHGFEELTLTSLLDDVYGDVSLVSNPAISSTTCTLPLTMTAGGFAECTFRAAVSGDIGVRVTDTVTATVLDDERNQVRASDEAVVTVGTKPPETGVDLPPSFMVGGLAILGLLLVGAGALLRRRIESRSR